MTFTGVMTILMYALAPFAWLIVAGVVVLVGAHLLAYMRGYQLSQYRCHLATALAALLGLSALAWIPMLTNSQLGYINTMVDWLGLLGGVVGTFIVAFLLLHPLSYLVRGQDT